MVPGYAEFPRALEDLVVVELGSRVAVGACGALLAQSGARVIFAEYAGQARADWKWASRPTFAAGKSSLVVDSGRDSVLAGWLAAADVVLTSSDVDPAWAALQRDMVGEQCIVCDITGFGPDADHARAPVTDAGVQALTGIAETTGRRDGPPVLLKVPVVEYSAGVYAASGIVSVLSAVRAGGETQTVDVSLYDCGVNALTTFLPAHFGGGVPMRLGNGHSMAVPWNAYPTRDGWLMICSATDAQWQRICDAFGAPEMAGDPRFAKLSDRTARRDEIDGIVSAWTARFSIDDVVAKLTDHGVAHGMILPVRAPEHEPNLVHRAMIRTVYDSTIGRTVRYPGSVLRTGGGTGRIAAALPEADGARTEPVPVRKTQDASERTQSSGRLPFQGLKVVEIGQYTTAPLVGRHLATLGAEVIKVEPPTGDAARAWAPVRSDIGLFFFMSNCGKESITLDLKKSTDRDLFVDLIQQADVFIENLRPGSMERLGLGAAELSRINPGLVYCQITGFGMDSVHGQKPAFDTVVQAASGLMDANSDHGVPLKAGISAGDFMGGQVAFFAVATALRQRAADGRGQYIDMSMQDVAAWMSSSLWDVAEPRSPGDVVGCADGNAVVTPAANTDLARKAAGLSRADFVSQCAEVGIDAYPVRSVAEVVACPVTEASGLIRNIANEAGQSWPALKSPIRLSRTPPVFGRAIGLPRPIGHKRPAFREA